MDFFSQILSAALPGVGRMFWQNGTKMNEKERWRFGGQWKKVVLYKYISFKSALNGLLSSLRCNVIGLMIVVISLEHADTTEGQAQQKTDRFPGSAKL